MVNLPVSPSRSPRSSPSTPSVPYSLQHAAADAQPVSRVPANDTHRHLPAARIFPVLSNPGAVISALSPSHGEQRANAQDVDGETGRRVLGTEGHSGFGEPRDGASPRGHGGSGAGEESRAGALSASSPFSSPPRTNSGVKSPLINGAFRDDAFLPLISPGASASFLSPAARSNMQEKTKETPVPLTAEDIEHLQAKASIAANLEKWPDVIRAMKKVAQARPNFDATQRSLVIHAYTNLANEARHARKTLDGYSSALSSLRNWEAPARDAQGGHETWKDEKSEKQAHASEREAKRKRAEEERLATRTLGNGLVPTNQLREFEPFFEFCVGLYKQRITEDLASLNEDLDRFVLGVLLPQAENLEAAAAYQQLRGDVSRHTAALAKNADVRRRMEERALRAYESGLQFTEQDAELKVTALHLGIVLNYGCENKHTRNRVGKSFSISLKKEDCGDDEEKGILLKSMNNGEQTNRAIELVASEFRYSVENMYQVRNEEEYQRVLVILGLLRDNIENWCAETGRTDVQTLLGMDYHTQSSGQSLDAGSVASLS
ncbi:putative 14-3-3 protein [Neospora caninum Liverpool]|uniref:Putative 14-3-3 protein n=1 Tax=Neospora caninum (strain Liverpool) TaxID=572307 RepID=F0VJH0_NEOCL|nr:putative 14-3-3 protein [Neospora caninum Liverpool]CBZ53881.1 putative 14-3-3 protein [Neospora caninum Liverpool]|eukprot:XP_003883913.1 putative 14-3-3 protein [Neospora caninum Liverpool]